MRALSYFEQIKESNLDGRNNDLALKNFQQIIDRFPESKYARDSEQKILFIKENIAAKHMNIAIFYQNEKKYLASLKRYQVVIEEHSTSRFIPEALFRLVEIYYILGMLEDANKSALRWIERVGLSGYEDKYPQHLSGGMQQRVGLARALTNDGDILLMDEAFSALDPLIRKDMQDILLELQDELHKTVVFITHDLDEALKIGDRIAILKDGIMDQEGIPAEILLNPKTKYVKDFVEDVNRARVIKAKHIMSEINGQDLSGAMPIDQDDYIDRFIDKVISDKPDNLVIQDKDKKNVGFLSTKKLSEILKR